MNARIVKYLFSPSLWMFTLSFVTRYSVKLKTIYPVCSNGLSFHLNLDLQSVFCKMNTNCLLNLQRQLSRDSYLIPLLLFVYERIILGFLVIRKSCVYCSLTSLYIFPLLTWHDRHDHFPDYVTVSLSKIMKGSYSSRPLVSVQLASGNDINMCPIITSLFKWVV